jgi:hypothetical protein
MQISMILYRWWYRIFGVNTKNINGVTNESLMMITIGVMFHCPHYVGQLYNSVTRD